MKEYTEFKNLEKAMEKQDLFQEYIWSKITVSSGCYVIQYNLSHVICRGD